MVRKNLLNRVLPAVLSAAMLVTSAPATVMAAEPTAETNSVETESVFAEDVAPEEIQDILVEDAPVEAVTQSSAEVPAVTADAVEEDIYGVGEVSATLSFDPLELKDTDNTEVLKYDEYTKVISGTYGATYRQIRNQILDTVVLKRGASTLSGFYATYKLKNGSTEVSDEDAESTTNAPAGSYTATISYAAVEDTNTAATDITVDFTINKETVRVSVDRSAQIATTVKTVKEKTVRLYKGTTGYYTITPKEDPTITVSTSIGGTALADDYSLVGNEEYYLHVAATLTDDDAKNYEIDASTADVKLIVTDKAAGKIAVANEPAAKDYDGTEFALTLEGLGASVTYKVGDTDKKLDSAVFTGEWLDGAGDGRVLSSAPVNAGTYVYRLYFTDATDTVVDSEDDADNVYCDVPVVINPVKITITPALASGAKVYAGASLSASDIAALVGSYTIKNASGADITEQLKSESAFGSAYNYKSRNSTQAYEPVFALYRGEESTDPDDDTKKVTTWTEVDEIDNTVADGVSYALGFSGEVAIYDRDGDVTNTVTVEKLLQNYTVDTSYTALSAGGVALTIEKTGGTYINVDDMQIDSKGNSVANTYVKKYDGEQLFANREAYKKGKALVSGTQAVAAEGTALSYQWQVANTSSISGLFRLYQDVDENATALVEPTEEPTMPTDTTDAEKMKKYYAEVAYYRAWTEGGNFNYTDGAGDRHYYYGSSWKNLWSDKNYDVDADGETRDFGDGTTMISPRSAGFYRLKVTYDNEAYGSNEPGYAYYTIQPKDAMAVISGTPSTYYGTKVQDFIYGITSDLITATLSEATVSDTGAATAGAAIELTEEQQAALVKNYSSYFKVQRKYQVPTATTEAKWDDMTNLEKFEKNPSWDSSITCSYRLVFSATGADFAKNYNFGNKLGVHNEVIESGFFTYTGSALDITVNDSEGKTVSLKIDGTLEKTYDGKPADASTIKIVATTYEDGKIVDVTSSVKMHVKFNGVDAQYAVHGGTYDVYVYTEGDATYASASTTAEYKINKKELTLVPTFAEDPVLAGKYVSDWASGTSYSDVVSAWYLEDETQLVEGDENVFKNVLKRSYIVPTTGKWDDEVYSHILRSGETYLAKTNGDGVDWNTRYDENLLDYISYSSDYKIADSTTPFTVKRAAATVSSSKSGERDDNSYTEDNYASWKHDIAPTAAIESDNHTHWYQIKITAPTEITEDTNINGYGLTNNDFVYKNAIEAVGGEIVSAELEGTSITVRFNADDEKFKTAQSFDITWMPGYVEHFTVDLSSAELLEDLTLAVDPKTLAFASKSLKLAVGESQQLDVKITKKKMADIIWLGYESSDPEVLQVTSSSVGDAAITDVNGNTYNGAGYATALKAGSATVTVYARRKVYDKDGNETAEEKLTKTATINVTITEVDAPKINKVTVHDTYAIVDYEKPANGYRREIYVLKGTLSAEAAETAVASVTNGVYGDDFAYQAIYDVDAGNYTVEKKKTIYHATVGSSESEYNEYMLVPGTEYTIYLRNVSGLKTLDDGSRVAISAKGAVKTIKTTAAEIDGITLTAAVPARAYDEKVDKVQYDYYATLDDKKVTLTPSATVYAKKTADSAAEAGDNSTVAFADLGSTYTTPKVTYVVMEPIYIYDGGDEDYYCYTYLSASYYNEYSKNFTSAEKKQYASVKTNDGKIYYKKSNLATVTKKGVVTLKSKGIANILAIDTVSGAWGVCDLFIDATPDSVSAKSVKLNVGESVNLASLLTYKQGGKKLVDYQSAYDYDYYYDTSDSEWYRINATWPALTLDAATLSQTGLDVETYDGYNSFGQYYSYSFVTALDPGLSLSLSVTDAVAGTATVRVKSPALSPVKALKTSFVADDRATITWTYPVRSGTFKIDVLDGDKKIVYSNVESSTGYDLKKTGKVYYYYYDLSNPDNDSDYLVRKSKYTAQVTVLSTNSNTGTTTESKVAKRNFKTTDVPASYRNLSHNNYGLKNSEVSYGGMPIKVVAGIGKNVTSSNAGRDLTDNALLTGNIYTMYASLSESSENIEAKLFMSDKLTWKSTNTKVAKVKTLTGSFSAQLKAQSAGTTNIQVTSKDTKKVIANWKVTVVPVGDATNYYGENEPYGRSTSHLRTVLYKPENIAADEIIGVTLGSPVVTDIRSGERQWFVFTAPADGNYSATALFSDKAGKYGTWSSTEYDNSLRKGQKIYLSVESPQDYYDQVMMTVNGTVYTELSGVGTHTVKAGTDYVFYAPEYNYYTFKYMKATWTTSQNYGGLNGVALNKGGKYTINIVGNGDYQLVISKRNLAGSLSTEKDVDITVAYDTDVWYTFTAKTGGLYDFSFSTTEDETFAVERYETIISENATDTTLSNIRKAAAGSLKNVPIAEGNTIVFKVTSSTLAKDKTAKLIAAKVVQAGDVVGDLTDKNTESVTVSAASPAMYTYTANNAGIYKFTASSVTVTIVGEDSQTKRVVDGGVYLSAGEEISIVVSTDSETDVTGTMTIEDSGVTNGYLTIHNTSVPATASPLQTGWYRLNVYTESGQYEFNVTDGSKAVTISGTRIANYGRGDESSFDLTWGADESGSKTTSLNAGDYVYFSVAGDDVTDRGLTISYQNPVNIVSVDYDGEEYQHTSISDSFTVSKTGTYTVTMDYGDYTGHQDVWIYTYVNGVRRDVKVYYYDDEDDYGYRDTQRVNYYGQADGYYQGSTFLVDLNAGENVYYAVTPYYSDEYPEYHVSITAAYTEDED